MQSVPKLLSVNQPNSPEWTPPNNKNKSQYKQLTKQHVIFEDKKEFINNKEFQNDNFQNCLNPIYTNYLLDQNFAVYELDDIHYLVK